MANLNPTDDLTHFKGYDDQDKKDLAYSEQKKPMQSLVKKTKNHKEYTDTSISRDWTPEED
ncbi:MAG: hypothetical protein R3E66_24195 [bacterium]